MILNIATTVLLGDIQTNMVWNLVKLACQEWFLLTLMEGQAIRQVYFVEYVVQALSQTIHYVQVAQLEVLQKNMVHLRVNFVLQDLFPSTATEGKVILKVSLAKNVGQGLFLIFLFAVIAPSDFIQMPMDPPHVNSAPQDQYLSTPMGDLDTQGVFIADYVSPELFLTTPFAKVVL